MSAIHSDAYRRRLPYAAGRLRKARKQGFEPICYPHFRRKGYLLPFYMIGYGTIRFFVEGLRSDSLYLLPGIRVSQVLSGCLIILGIVILFIISKRQVVRQ
nr:prolipoprotein diacylglyceryl transferase family protein [Ruminococcus sp. AM36-18]